MGMVVTCSCGGRFQAEDEWAGRQAKCPHCGAVVIIPSAQAAPASEPVGMPDLTDEESSRSSGAEASGSAPGSRSGDEAFRIQIESDVHLPQPEEISQTIRETLYEHVVTFGADAFEDVDLQVTVLDWALGYVALVVAGQVNGRQMSRRFEADRSMPLARITAREKRKVGHEPGRRRRMLPLERESLMDCLVNVCLELNRAAGRRPSIVSRIWTAIVWAQLALVGVTGAVTAIVMHRDAVASGTPSRNTKWWVIGSAAMMMFFTYFAVYCVALAFMPAEFFRIDPRGRRALRWSGMRSVAALRVLAALVPLMICGIAIGGYLFLKSRP